MSINIKERELNAVEEDNFSDGKVLDSNSIKRMRISETSKRYETAKVQNYSLDNGNVLGRQSSGLASSSSLSQLSLYSVAQLSLFLSASVKNSDILEVRAILGYFNSLAEKPSLMEIKDFKEFSLLHTASFNNQAKIVEMLLQYERVVSRGEEVRRWCDMQNGESFTAIHFAAYRGSLLALQYLVEFGGNLSVLNEQGQSALSIAAQGDQVKVLVWLRMKGLSFTQRDMKGGTALHWACFYGSEFSVQYLLSWVARVKGGERLINIQDNDGMTALHLGAMTGNVRIVKKLLLRGADKGLKDQRGQTAAQCASENGYDNVAQVLQQSNCFLEFMNIKTRYS